jgi:1,4-dihydroxy-2-naphthoate octaprenyltransferase
VAIKNSTIDSLPSIHPAKAWLLAARPKTLSVSLVPILIATTFAFRHVNVNWMLSFFAFLSSLCIQIGTNLVNDALDYKSGVDRADRIGSKRMTQTGILPFQKVFYVGCFSFLCATLFGIPLIMTGGWVVCTILLLSIVCGYCYTGGPFPLAHYPGISEICILFFFGWVSTCTLYYLQTFSFSFPCFVASTQVGLLAIVPHAINNLRDRLSDQRAGKRTFSVYFGCKWAKRELIFCTFLPFLLGFIWILWEEWGMALFPLATLPLAIRNISNILQTEPSIAYNQFLSKSAYLQLLFALSLLLGSFVH